MLFSVDVLSLLLYCVQQVGVMLAVGAETIVLVAYLVALRDGVVDEKEIEFTYATRRALVAGLGLIVVSGIGATLLHFDLSQNAIVFQPAYLFKWMLIVGLFMPTLFGEKETVLSHPLGEGFVAGSWYALFVVHILAPITTWSILFILYALWLTVFVGCWSFAMHFVHSKRGGRPVLVPFQSQVALAPQPIVEALPRPVLKGTLTTPLATKISIPFPTFAKKSKPVVPQTVGAMLEATPLKRVAGKAVQSVPMPQKPFIRVPYKPSIEDVPVPFKPDPVAVDALEKLEQAGEGETLPVLRVMPRTPEDIAQSLHAVAV